MTRRTSVVYNPENVRCSLCGAGRLARCVTTGGMERSPHMARVRYYWARFMGGTRRRHHLAGRVE